jgi:hypothetical protein
MAVIELAPRAAVHGQHADARLLGDACQIGCIATGLVPSGPHLQGHRKLHRLYGGFKDLRGMHLIAHQRRPGMAVHDLLHRAAEIDIDDGSPTILVELGGLGHHFGLAAGELHRHRELFGGVLGHQQRLAILAHHRGAGDHFGDDEARAASLDHLAERHVADSGHRSQDDWILDPDRTDFQCLQARFWFHFMISL